MHVFHVNNAAGVQGAFGRGDVSTIIHIILYDFLQQTELMRGQSSDTDIATAAIKYIRIIQSFLKICMKHRSFNIIVTVT